MDAMHTCVGSLVVTSGVEALHSPEELRVRREHVFERPMPVAGFTEENSTGFLQNLSFNDCVLVRERMLGQIALKNAVPDFEQAFWTNGLGPSGTEGRRCSFAYAL
jgi:hypothetical protein